MAAAALSLAAQLRPYAEAYPRAAFARRQSISTSRTLMTPSQIRVAIRSFLALLDATEPTAEELDDALGQCLDTLALARHFAAYTFDDAEHPEGPSSDYKTARPKVESRFPDYGYYNVPKSVLDNVGESGCNVGDSIDDLVDIASDLRDVEWRWRHTSQDDAIWHFAHTFDFHWGAHLRGLQQYLLARRGTAA